MAIFQEIIAGMKISKAFTSALTLGITFSSMSMVIGYMTNAVGLPQRQWQKIQAFIYPH